MPAPSLYARRVSTNDDEDGPLDPAKLESEATLHLIATGYSDLNAFLADCQYLVKELALIAPFGELAKATKFAVYAYYEAAPAGYQLPIRSTAPVSPIAPALGAYYQTAANSAQGKLHLDYEKFVALGERSMAWESDIDNDLPLLVTPAGAVAHQYAAGAILLLLPEARVGDGAVGSYAGLSLEDTFRVEVEHLPTEAEPIYFAATTCNPGYERLAARAIALQVGLGDESEQQPQLPTEAVGQVLAGKPNLIYAPTPAQAAQEAQAPKWQPLVSQAAFTVQPRPDSATAAAVDETSSPLVAPQTPLALWEGGGGYTNGIYRPAHDCLLRRRPGSGSLLFKLSQHPFCPVCRIYLLKAITGEYSTKHAADSVTLATQRSQYNKVHWGIANTEQYDAQKPAPATFTVEPDHEAFKYPAYVPTNDPTHVPLAFWGYTCHFSDKLPPKGVVQPAGTVNAFYFDQVRVHQSRYYDGPAGNKQKKASRPTDVRDVFSRIGFHSLKVTFDNSAGPVPAPYEVVIADYIRDNNYKLKRAWSGHLGGDHLYQTGWQLLLIEDRKEWPRLEIELSVVMRGPAPDFDPGGVADALKCYPQIQFRWSRRAGSTIGVKQFEGTVQAVVNTKHYTYDATMTGSRFKPGHHMAGMSMNMDPAIPLEANDVSCFADSNMSARYYYYPNTLMKRKDVEYPSPATKPTWAAIFDYYTPHVAQGNKVNNVPLFSKDFVGVHRHDPAVRQGQVRKLYVHHQVAEPPCEGDGFTPLFITKFPRQGGYDNIHVNGYMGKHQAYAEYPTICDETAISNEDVVAAPFCGLDCFHMHWRWSLLSDTIATVTSFNNSFPNPFVVWQIAPAFRGWNTKRSHSQIGAPLIPPNQRLDMHLEAFDHAQPRLDKIVNYKVTVDVPAPDENQVILEQGMGWAMIESDLLAAKLGPASVLYAPPMPHGLASLVNEDTEAAFSKVYDYIRFHHEFSRVPSGDPTFDALNPYADKIKIFNHAQVPDGLSMPTLTWPSTGNSAANSDVILNIYRRRGEMLNLSLYPRGQQVLIEGNGFDNIAIEEV